MICLACTVRIVKQTRQLHYLGREKSVTVDWLLLTRWRSLVRHVTMRARAARRHVRLAAWSVDVKAACCAHVEFYRLNSYCRVLIRVQNC